MLVPKPRLSYATYSVIQASRARLGENDPSGDCWTAALLIKLALHLEKTLTPQEQESGYPVQERESGGKKKTSFNATSR